MDKATNVGSAEKAAGKQKPRGLRLVSLGKVSEGGALRPGKKLFVR
jgi:hypothetical protein